jgi:hypothetical protein
MITFNEILIIDIKIEILIKRIQSIKIFSFELILKSII